MLTLRLGEPAPDGSRYVAAIGNFDGVHLGHQYLLGRVMDSARGRGLLSLAITFWPHPRELLHPAGWPGGLTTLPERRVLLGALGLDALLVLPFTPDLAGRSPEEFVALLAGAVPLAELWVGADFRFGRGRSGDVAELRRLAAARGVDVRAIERLADAAPPRAETAAGTLPDRSGADGSALSFPPHDPGPVPAGGDSLGSDAIRARLRAGDVEGAARLLGRPYRLGGLVVPGDRRGRELGYPTANLQPDPGKLVPGRAIYAALARSGDLFRPAAGSIGVRPQFGGDRELVEAYLLDFAGDLYGRCWSRWTCCCWCC